jgi:FtsH-binding integral membrane protein
MNKHIVSYSIATIITLLILFNAFKNGKSTCDSYITNTYLYMTLGITIIGYIALVASEYPLNNKLIILTIISTFLLIFALVVTPQNNVPFSHFFWILLLFALGYILNISIRNSSSSHLKEALVLTAIVFFSMTFISFFFQNSIKNHLHQLGSVLFASLLSVIFLELYYIFFVKDFPRKLKKQISYFVILLFSAFLVYDSSSMQVRSKLCLDNSNPANYPKESLNLILDLINLFVRFLDILR